MTQERIQASAGNFGVLLEVNHVLGQPGKFDLCLQDVLLGHLAHRVFDSGRLHCLPGDGNVPVVDAKLILSAQQIVECFAHPHPNIEPHVIERRLGFGDIASSNVSA